MPPPVKRKLVTIEGSTLAGMATNAKIVAEFPFLSSLKTAAPAGRGCGGCGRANAARSAAVNAAKRAIAGLPSDKKRRLAALLNAEQVRLTYISASNNPVTLTIDTRAK